MKVMVGGTFDPFHAGHRKLLGRSFGLAGAGGLVVIGLTTDEFAGRKSHPVRPFGERKRDLERFIREEGFAAAYRIEPLGDRVGPAADEDFEALVVSEETLLVGMEINRLRQERGKRKVDLHQISCVLADDGRWISSTRIYRGEIDPEGRLVR
jgi:pantetheine-phosphate adenylyltransferase